MLNIVLFGPPGSGKGTQATKLCEQFNLTHISTGDLLREEIKNETPLGLEAQKFMDNGILVPDEVVIGMLGSKIDASIEGGSQGFIFDGFPRTVDQAEALDKLLELKEANVGKVLFLTVDEDELVNRLLERGKTSGRADDQNEEKIRTRLQEYNNKTLPVAEYYEGQNKVNKIDGVGGIEDIFCALSDALTDIIPA